MITIDLSQVPTNALEQELNRRKQEAVTARKANDHSCNTCHGKGTIDNYYDPFAGFIGPEKCYVCNGTGSVRY